MAMSDDDTSDIDRRVYARRAPHHVDVLIVHYGEKPCAQIAARLPQMSLGHRAHESVLNKIIRPVRSPRKRPRIAAEPRDLMLHKTTELGHITVPLRSRQSGADEEEL